MTNVAPGSVRSGEAYGAARATIVCTPLPGPGPHHLTRGEGHG